MSKKITEETLKSSSKNEVINEIVAPEESNTVEEVIPTPSTPAKSIDPSGKSQIMKAHLAKQEKVMFLVPLEAGEAKGTQLPVILNGYRLNIPKGVLCPIPRQVAEMLAEKYNIEMEAGRDHLIDRDNAHKEALI